MNEQFLEKRLISLISEKKYIEEKIGNNNNPVITMAICVIGGSIASFIMPKPKSSFDIILCMLMMISFSLMMMWIKGKIVNIHTSKNKLIQLKEEIEKQLSTPNIQKKVITNVNALLLKYPNNENIAENAKKLKTALINKEYNLASSYLSSLINKIKDEKELKLYEHNKIQEQKKIDKYEKEIGVKIFSNEEINNKEIEKGWTNVL